MLSITRRCAGNITTMARLVSALMPNQVTRSYAKRDCGSGKKSKCGKVKKITCGEKIPERAKLKVKKPPFVSMWRIKDCDMEDQCKFDLRYDMKYYKISDKKKRKYQVTWVDCPRIIIKPRKVCIHAKVRRPKIKRRKFRRSGGSLSSTREKGCGKNRKAKCVYIKAPCCKVGRKPPKCKSAFKSLGGCKKRLTPYPSFSECKKDPTIPPPPIECKCLSANALCDAWAILRRRVARGLKPIKECGEA